MIKRNVTKKQIKTTNCEKSMLTKKQNRKLREKKLKQHDT